MSYQIADVTPGATYSFRVVAVSDGNRSNAAATKIQVPGAVKEEPELEEPELEETEIPEIPEIPYPWT